MPPVCCQFHSTILMTILIHLLPFKRSMSNTAGNKHNESNSIHAASLNNKENYLTKEKSEKKKMGFRAAAINVNKM